jgi:L-2-hydroxycarboxylate dehydrogenase (NAD+)
MGCFGLLQQVPLVARRSRMNKTPEKYDLVAHERLSDFVVRACLHVGVTSAKAELLAELLTGNDLRGVFSHGTAQIATYAILFRDGVLNNEPNVQIVQETDTSLLVDGDGGLGYFPAHEGTGRVIEKAKERGIAIMMTRNHGHFGAAGLYSRMTLEHDLISFVTSGHQLHLKPGGDLFGAGGGSPMSFSAPAGDEPDLVLDFGALHDLYGGNLTREDIALQAPGLVLRCIGMGEVCQAWGGLLSGLPLHADSPRWSWPGANQGSMVITFRIDLFLEPAAFKNEMDEYVRAVRQLQPLAGLDEAHMPGGIESERETRSRRDGVPVGTNHRKRLDELASELGIASPW